MTTGELIEQKLPKDIWETAKKYTIPNEFLEDSPDLIELILRSRSIDTTEEKQNRFNLLPLMNVAQLEKLRSILMREKEKLQEIEEKYEDKKQEIKKKYLQKRQDMGYVKEVSETKQKEKTEKQKDDNDAESLLSSL